MQRAAISTYSGASWRLCVRRTVKKFGVGELVVQELIDLLGLFDLLLQSFVLVAVDVPVSGKPRFSP